MLCKFCNKHIGFARWVVDDEYCCPEHRACMRTVSARWARDARDRDDPAEDGEARQPAQRTSGSLLVLLLGMGIGMGAVLAPWFTPDAAAQSSSAGEGKPASSVRSTIRQYAAVRLMADFRERSAEWAVVKGAARTPKQDGWVFHNGAARPGRFRLWQPSLPLTDYEFAFTAQLERKGLGWGWRATDTRNYYGSKLVVVKPGALPVVHLVRWARVDGSDSKCHEIQLPLTVRSDTVYAVRVKVNGPDMIIEINGRIVDAWTDDRLSSGGVAFFAAEDESAVLRSVSVRQRDTFVGRLLAHLSLLSPVIP
jgi:hypothetical protein